MNEQTPLMEQYERIKAEHQDEVLFFRLGDFYEMFNSDAEEVSRLLNLTLTHRGNAPMCGIPHHASKSYIARLLRHGKKIAVCEQIGPVSPSGYLTERKVVEVITPGTVVEDDYLEQSSNNFLSAMCVSKGVAGFAYIDVSTADFFASAWKASSMAENFSKELSRANPAELLLPETLRGNEGVLSAIAAFPSMLVSYYPDWHFSNETSFAKLTRQFKTQNLLAFSLEKNSPEVGAAGFLLDYIEKSTNAKIDHISSIKVCRESEFVVIDDASRRNLEILRNLQDGSTAFTLLETVNFTMTAMGNRTIRQWISSPLVDIGQIEARQSHVRLFFESDELLAAVRAELSKILDMERLASRIAMERAHAKDLLALASSIDSWLVAQEQLMRYDFGMTSTNEAKRISELIHSAICDDPSTSLTEGRLIRKGYSEELDRYKEIEGNFNQILSDYIDEEIESSGILNLRVKNNGTNGYFLEVTKSKIPNVPSHFIMRRSLTNVDRYTTPRLQELERELVNASSNIIETEHRLFVELRAELAKSVPYLMSLAREIAYTDAAASFAYAARVNRWVCPEVNGSLEFCIRDGRHPVVEMHLPSGEFVPNDLTIRAYADNSGVAHLPEMPQSFGTGAKETQTPEQTPPAAPSSADEIVPAAISVQPSADETKNSFSLITGPNMAGKSTYLRQTALIALLAQAGSFVPASYARIGIVDKVFCRVGASDNLARGESTFLVEMTETARILRGATNRSLVIMDEVGRGTSTEDGLSIAWAVSEHLFNTIKCRTLFATHYHELTRLEHPSMKLLCMDVRDTDGGVVFLRKIKEGASENSYGIHVARLAGIPQSVIVRANAILSHLQRMAGEHPLIVKDEINTETKPASPVQSPGLFNDEEIVLDEILSADLDNITPLAALKMIDRWKSLLRN